MSKKVFFCTLMMTVFFLGTMRVNIMALNVTELTKELPLEINGWKKSRPIIYTPGNLYDYIDGGAELYISYNFINMAAQKYIKKEDDEISVDIFNMGNSFSAFGVFAHSRESVDHSIAPLVESEYDGGLLTFWKGNYYVSIMAYPETEEKKKTVLSLGRSISGLIKEESRKPPLIKRMPGENLAAESIRYFFHHAWLNSHYYISDRNILHIGKGTEAVLARYRDGTSAYFVLLISYPDRIRAESARQSFMKYFLPDARQGVQRRADGRWTGCRQEGNLIIIVLAAPGEAIVNNLLTSIKEEI